MTDINTSSDLLLWCEDERNELLAKLTESSVLVYESNWSCTVVKSTKRQLYERDERSSQSVAYPTCKDKRLFGVV